MNFREFKHLISLRTNTNRIILVWSNVYKGMDLIYSDDSGNNWSQPIEIRGAGIAPAQYRRTDFLNLSQLNNGKIVLSFTGFDDYGYYRVSNDNGHTWQDEDLFEYPVTSDLKVNELSIISIEDGALLGEFQLSNHSLDVIYSQISSDGGSTWSDTLRIVDSGLRETRPKITKDNEGAVWLFYEQEYMTSISEFTQRDITVLKSIDNGLSWQNEGRFTAYVGDDKYQNASTFSNKTFVTFSSERLSNEFILFYGIFNESEDSYTPPKVFSSGVPTDGIDYENDEYIYQATVIDNELVSAVTLGYEDYHHSNQLFDDGMHFDEEANDRIYGNIFPLVTQTRVNSYLYEVNNIKLPLDNKGILADARGDVSLSVNIVSSDRFGAESALNTSINLGRFYNWGKFEEGIFIFSGGFELSGYSNGELWANGVATSKGLVDYVPGKVGILAEDSDNYKIYIVNKYDQPFGDTWKYWGEAVKLGAHFYDGDEDGYYNPVDKNWNGSWDDNEDMPPIIGDEIAWCIYNDGISSDQRLYENVEPLGIEIQQTLFASSDQELENVVFIKYKITNTG